MMTRHPTASSTWPSEIVNQRGSSSVELALVVPALVLMLGLLVGGGRLWFARTTVQEAAHTAARAASLARSAEQATADGTIAGRESMSTSGLRCLDFGVTFDLAAFATPVGVPASVTATVRCAVPFADVFLPGMPGTITLTDSQISAVDTHRSRR